MSRLWKSQELFGPPFGPLRADESVRLSVALDASAEHKLPDMTCADLPPHRFPAQVTNKPSANMAVSSSPFSGSLPMLTDDILAAYQEACIHGQSIPAFSPFTGPSTSSHSHSLGSSSLVQSSSTRDDTPVFSLADLSDAPTLRVPSPKLSPTLRASTGTLPSVSQKTHRRTRSHFYALGEAPIVLSGNDLQDDDESSDDEDVAPLEASPAPTNIWGKGFYTSASDVPIVKSTPMPLASRPVPKMRAIETEPMDLPDSPPTRLPTSMRASSTNLGAVSASGHHNSPKETHMNNPIFDTSAPDLFARPPPPSLSPVPEAPHCLHDLSISPSPAPLQNDVDYQRDLEWRTLEHSQALRFSMDTQESLSEAAIQNAHKNRYPQILALDATRVKLSGESDYINASYVRGAGDGLYISAQAPIPATYGDFWRMVWEQKVHVIVMLTRLIESGCPKAHKYWPTSKTRVYDEKYKVTLVNRLESTDYEYRVKEFEVEYEGERRRVFQFQFTGWPDHGVPSSPESLLRMMSSLNETLEEVRVCPFVEGPSPRVFEPPHIPDGRSSLNSSTSNSVKSASERPSLDEADHPWSLGSVSANTSSSGFNFGSGSGSSLHLPSSRPAGSAPSAGEAASAGPRIRRCSSSQLSQVSSSLCTTAPCSSVAAVCVPNTAACAPNTTACASVTSASPNAHLTTNQTPTNQMPTQTFGHQRHESASSVSIRDIVDRTTSDAVASTSSRSASQLTTRFSLHPPQGNNGPKLHQPPSNLIHNSSSNVSLSSIASVSSTSSTSSISTYSTGGGAPTQCASMSYGQVHLDSTPKETNGVAMSDRSDKSDGSVSPTSNTSLLSSYSSASSSATASSAHSNSSSSFGSLPSVSATGFSMPFHASPSHLGVPSAHTGPLNASYHQSPPFSLPAGVPSTNNSSAPSGIPASISPNLSSPNSAAASCAPGITPNPSRPTPCAAKQGYDVGPLLVHCSAGIGRSGAFILIHSVLEKLKADGKLQNDISLSTLLGEMRKCRVGLVPHQMQYNFCYNAIDYCLCYKNMQRNFGIPEPTRAKARQTAMQKSSLNRSSHVIPNFGSDSAFF